MTVIANRLRRLKKATAASPSRLQEKITSLAQNRSRILTGKQTSASLDFEQAQQLSPGLFLFESYFSAEYQHGDEFLEANDTNRFKFFSKNILPGMENCVFIDTETTGLAGGSGTLIFLFGIARVIEQQLVLKQFLITQYSCEATMLEYVIKEFRPDDCLFSYNGKSFDLPLLETRLRMHRMNHDLRQYEHMDLLHYMRRAFRDHWPDIRLCTVERRFLNFHRKDDMPGHMAPQAWFALLRYQRVEPIQAVLKHHSQDIVSLLFIAGKIQDLYYNPSMYSASVTAIANYWNSQDRADLAIDVLTRFVTHKTILPGECLRLLASLYRQQQNWTCAVRIWQQLAEKRCAQSLENLAKYYEHREKNYQQALTYARLMLPLVCDTTEVDYRIARLQGKLSRLCVVTKKHKMHVSSLNQGETSPCMLPLSMSS